MLASNESRERKIDQVRRVQLDLPPRAFTRLVKLKTDTESRSYAEVIKNALQVYATVIEQCEEGNEFMIKKPDGTVVPYPLVRI